jgi:hypothetical protein
MHPYGPHMGIIEILTLSSSSPSHIYLVEPKLFKGYNPKRKGFNQEVELTHNLEPMEVSEEEAAKFKLEHGNKCDTWNQPSGEWFVRFKRGACILIPKAMSFNCQPGGTQDVMAFLPTSLRRWIAPLFGLSSALQKLLSWLVSMIPTNSTSTYTLRRLEPVLAVVWVAWSCSLPCSMTGTPL